MTGTKGSSDGPDGKHIPKLSDELCKDVLEFGPEVPPHVIVDVPDALHLIADSETSVRHAIRQEAPSSERLRTMTVTCDASVLGSMMKRMTLMKPSAALTISLVREPSSRQMLYSSCSIVDASIESAERQREATINAQGGP